MGQTPTGHQGDLPDALGVQAEERHDHAILDGRPRHAVHDGVKAFLSQLLKHAPHRVLDGHAELVTRLRQNQRGAKQVFTTPRLRTKPCHGLARGAHPTAPGLHVLGIALVNHAHEPVAREREREARYLCLIAEKHRAVGGPGPRVANDQLLAEGGSRPEWSGLPARD